MKPEANMANAPEQGSTALSDSCYKSLCVRCARRLSIRGPSVKARSIPPFARIFALSCRQCKIKAAKQNYQVRLQDFNFSRGSAANKNARKIRDRREGKLHRLLHLPHHDLTDCAKFDRTFALSKPNLAHKTLE